MAHDKNEGDRPTVRMSKAETQAVLEAARASANAYAAQKAAPRPSEVEREKPTAQLSKQVVQEVLARAQSEAEAFAKEQAASGKKESADSSTEEP